MKNILTTKRFWGAIVSGIGFILHTLNIPIGDFVMSAGGAMIGAGVVDSTKK